MATKPSPKPAMPLDWQGNPYDPSRESYGGKTEGLVGQPVTERKVPMRERMAYARSKRRCNKPV